MKLYAVYDLLSLEMIERAADHAAVARAVVAANSACRRREREEPCAPAAALFEHPTTLRLHA